MIIENGSAISQIGEHAIPTSVGFGGKDFLRSYGRAYFNVENRIDDVATFQHEYETFAQESLEHGRRRHVFRARMSEEVTESAIKGGFPVEMALPLSLIDSSTRDHMVIVAEDILPISVPEWEKIYPFWKNPFGKDISYDTMTRAVDHGSTQFSLTDHPEERDIDTLSKLWWAFGWSKDQVAGYVAQGAYRTDTAWFSGVRDRTTGQLVAVTIGEQLQLSGVDIVESTEWATASGYEKQGLCQASATGLIAQILRDTEYAGRGTPLLMGEFNMASRADIAARGVGMTVPYVEGVHGLETTPRQVLRQNVSVLDHRAPNTRPSFMSFDPKTREQLREAYHMPYQYLRNFLVGMLSKNRIDSLYTKNAVEAILSLYK